MTSIRLYSSCVLMGAALAAAVPAHAQSTRPERPYRGLFANGVEDPQQSLEASGSVGAGFDNNVVADALGLDPGSAELNSNVKGGVGQASGSLGYTLNLDSITIGATGATTLHYYPTLGSEVTRRYFADLGVSVQATRDISVNVAASYMPYSLSSLYPYDSLTGRGGMVPPDLDLASSLQHYFTYTGGVDYDRRLTRRVSFDANYTFQLRDESVYTGQYVRQGAGGGLTFEVSRGLDLRAGYRYDDVDYGTGRRIRNHLIDAGVDYNRALSFSRRTTLSFNTGTTATSSPDSGAEETEFRVVGGAELNHEIGRTWSASLGYSRDVHLDAAWGDIVSSDGVVATLSGLINRRVDFQSSARVSGGAIGLSTADDNRYESYSGSASLGYALTRHVNLSLSYLYYRHRFDQGVVLPPDFANTFNRHSVRASVSVWAPLFQRGRRSNATR